MTAGEVEMKRWKLHMVLISAELDGLKGGLIPENQINSHVCITMFFCIGAFIFLLLLPVNNITLSFCIKFLIAVTYEYKC